MRAILVAYEKHVTRYFDASTDYLRDIALRMLMQERYDAGYWYDVDASKEVDEILGTRDLEEQRKKLHRFMKRRSDYEYEGWEVVSIEPVVIRK